MGRIRPLFPSAPGQKALVHPAPLPQPPLRLSFIDLSDPAVADLHCKLTLSLPREAAPATIEYSVPAHHQLLGSQQCRGTCRDRLLSPCAGQHAPPGMGRSRLRPRSSGPPSSTWPILEKLLPRHSIGRGNAKPLWLSFLCLPRRLGEHSFADFSEKLSTKCPWLLRPQIPSSRSWAYAFSTVATLTPDAPPALASRASSLRREPPFPNILGFAAEKLVGGSSPPAVKRMGQHVSPPPSG